VAKSTKTKPEPEEVPEETASGVLDPNRMSSIKDSTFGEDVHRSEWDSDYGRDVRK
jgi:hypothetical protein